MDSPAALTHRRIASLRSAARILLLGVAVALSPMAGAQLRKPEPQQQQEGVDVGSQSRMAGLVPAAQVENAANQQYHQLMQQAAAKKALAGPDHPQFKRVRAI